MPELPEVETSRRGIAPHLIDRRVDALTVRESRLRWPVPEILGARLPGARVLDVRRRAKYLLIDTDAGGSVLVHLGMSGSLRVLAPDVALRAHDHIDLSLDSGRVLRFNDPRRFGSWLWQPDGEVHPLLASLGPEPLSDAFGGAHLHRLSRGRTATVKAFVMDQSVVVGVGNIYAAEALFAAGISPRRDAGGVSLAAYQKLADHIQRILAHAIERGGTTLRDFISPDGLPGYFEQELFVYGRAGETCKVCAAKLKAAVIAQRATVWCPRCQK